MTNAQTTKDKKELVDITTKYVNLKLASDKKLFQVIEQLVKAAKNMLQKRKRDTT